MEKRNGNKLIGLTGGPCGGKSSVIAHLKRTIEDRGGSVLVQPEAATHFFSERGVQFGPGKLDVTDFQKHLIPHQAEQENSIMRLANDYKGQVLVILDRTILDSLAYMNTSDFDAILGSAGLTRDELLSGNRYDAIIDMVTAADGAESFYTLENNTARNESPAQARELEKKIQLSYTGAANMHIVDNSTNFSNKIRRVEQAVLQVLGLETIRMQKTFSVRISDESKLEHEAKKVIIDQAYLPNKDGLEERIRARNIGGAVSYYHTLKTSASGSSREVREQIISQGEYYRLGQRAQKGVKKTRYVITHNNLVLEVDKFIKGGKLLGEGEFLCQVNILDDSGSIQLPSWMQIQKEVTNDPAYRNYALAL